MALPGAVGAWLEQRHQAVLATSRADGSPQTSNVVYALLAGRLLVSVTGDRAKVRNLRRNPEAVLHVLGDSFGQYVAVRCHAELSPASTTPGDDVGRQLLAVYEAVRGAPHPDRDEFYRAMVDEQRLVVRLEPTRATTWGLDLATA